MGRLPTFKAKKRQGANTQRKRVDALSLRPCAWALTLVHEFINTVMHRSRRQNLSIVIGHLPFVIEDSQFRVVK